MKQPELQQMPVSEQIVILLALKNGLLDTILIEKIKDAQDALLKNFNNFPDEIIKRLSSNAKLSDDDSKVILKIAATILTPFQDKPKPDEDKATPKTNQDKNQDKNKPKADRDNDKPTSDKNKEMPKTDEDKDKLRLDEDEAISK